MDPEVTKASPNMRTRAWGPPLWFALVCIAMGYPESNPTEDQATVYRTFFTFLAYVLPCNLCRDSYWEYIQELPLDDYVMSSRRTLVEWVFAIHNKVNEKLGCKILNHEQLERKYAYFDKFRAKSCHPSMGGCTKALGNVRIPKRTKVITYVDEEALRDLQRRRRRKEM